MNALIQLVATIVNIYIYLIFAQVIMSWLVNFNVINRQNRFVNMIGEFLFKITEPVLRPIRRFLPNFGGLDISPIVLILLLLFLQRLLISDIAPAMGY